MLLASSKRLLNGKIKLTLQNSYYSCHLKIPNTIIPENQAIVSYWIKMSKLYEMRDSQIPLVGGEFQKLDRSRALNYARQCALLKSLPLPIRYIDLSSFENQPGCRTQFVSLVREFSKTGKLDKVGELEKSEEYLAALQLREVHGVGVRTAKLWYNNSGGAVNCVRAAQRLLLDVCGMPPSQICTPLSDQEVALRAQQNISDLRHNALNATQRLGLYFFDDLQREFVREEMDELKDKLVRQMHETLAGIYGPGRADLRVEVKYKKRVMYIYIYLIYIIKCFFS